MDTAVRALSCARGLPQVTSLAWKADGSRLTVGNLCGAIECYDACIRRYKYQVRSNSLYKSAAGITYIHSYMY